MMSTVSRMKNIDSLHTFYYYEDKKLVTLDVVPDASICDDQAFTDLIIKELKSLYSNLEFNIIIDYNY